MCKLDKMLNDLRKLKDNIKALDEEYRKLGNKRESINDTIKELKDELVKILAEAFKWEGMISTSNSENTHDIIIRFYNSEYRDNLYELLMQLKGELEALKDINSKIRSVDEELDNLLLKYNKLSTAAEVIKEYEGDEL